MKRVNYQVDSVDHNEMKVPVFFLMDEEEEALIPIMAESKEQAELIANERGYTLGEEYIPFGDLTPEMLEELKDASETGVPVEVARCN